jgi:hypothetical protein
MVKNLPLALLVPLLPVHLAYMALTLWRHPRKSSNYFSATLAGLRAAFSGIGPIVKARRNIQKRRKVSAVAVARMLCWNPRKLWRCDSDIRPIVAVKGPAAW